MASKYDSTVTSLFSGGKLTTSNPTQNTQVNAITQPKSLFANTQPVQQPVTSQYKPISTKPVTITDQAQGLINNVYQTIKNLDVKKIGQSLVSGAKALPGQVEQAGGIILKGLVSQKDATDAFFNPAKKLFGVPQYDVDKKMRQKILDTSQQFREQGTKKVTQVQEQYQKEKAPSKGFQSLMESVAYNLPQVAASTGLSVATALITKNPALAASIGVSTSYGLGAGEVYNEARKSGQSDKQALPLSMAGGVIIGALDFLPLNRLLKNTQAVETVKKSIIQKISLEIVSLGTQAGFEGITEGAQEFVGNAIARAYNEHKDLFEGITEAGLVGAILGGVGDVTVNTITGISDAISSRKIDKVIQTALNTDPQKRTPEQQSIVESLLTKQMSPDEAASYVLENNLGKTEYGKQIMLSVLEAKKSNKDIRIEPSPDEKSLNVTLVDKGSDVEIKTEELIQKIEEKPTEIVKTKDTQKESDANSPENIKWFSGLQDDMEKLNRGKFIESLPRDKTGKLTVDPKKEISKMLDRFNKKYGTQITTEDFINGNLPERNDLLLKRLGYVEPKPSTGGEIGGITLYHGSDKVFDEMKVGQPTKRRMMMGEYDTTSHGMFFTPDKKIAGEYGKNVGEYRVNVKNPLDFRDRKNDAIFNEFDKLIANDPTIDIKPGEPGFSEFMYFDGELGKKFTQFIKSKGFDGAKLKETSEFSKGDFDTIVALDNAQVKSIKPSSGEIPKGVTDTKESQMEGVSTVGEVAQKRFDELKAKQGKPKKDLKIEYATNLSDEGDAIQKRFGQYLEENYDEARRIYKEKFGKVLNTDQARELSIDYAPDGINEITDKNKEARAIHAADVHEPSSSFIKQMFEDDINELLAKGKQPEVLFTAGGTGAGKSTAIKNIPEIKALQDHADIVYDTNLNGYNSAVKKIDKILSVGGEVGVAYVHRDVIDSFTRGALPRAMKMGRTVPYGEHIKTHTEVAPTILKLIEHYKGNPDEVHFRVIDNSLGSGNAKEKNLDFIDEIHYNKDEVKDKILLALDEEYAKGKQTNYKEGINQSVYEGTLGNTNQVADKGKNGSDNGVVSKESESKRGKVGEEPIGASKEKKPSRLFERIKETLGDDYSTQDRKYSVLDLEKQAEQVASLIESDPERSARIAYGLEEAPQGMTRNAMSVGLAEVARSKEDWTTAAKLWTKTSLRSTRYGQEIVSLRGNLTETNPLNYVKRVLSDRLDKIAKNYKSLLEGLDIAENASPQQKAVAIIKKRTTELKEQLMKRKKDFKTAQSIIDALRC